MTQDGSLNLLINRRKFVTIAAGGFAGESLLSVSSILAARLDTRSQIKAIAFDGFVIFDPRPVSGLAHELFPGMGTVLSDEWQTRQFEYTWLRIASRHYADFWQVTQDALVFAANKLKLELNAEKRVRLMNAYLELKTWPDVLPVISALKQSGRRLAFLSNFTPAMLAANIRHSGLDGVFEYALSTDQPATLTLTLLRYRPDSWR